MQAPRIITVKAIVSAHAHGTAIQPTIPQCLAPGICINSVRAVAELQQLATTPEPTATKETTKQ